MKNDVWRAPRSNDARDILKSQEISACRKRKEKNLDEHRQMEKDTGRLSGDTLSSDVADVRLCIRDAKEQFCGKETDNEQFSKFQIYRSIVRNGGLSPGDIIRLTTMNLKRNDENVPVEKNQ